MIFSFILVRISKFCILHSLTDFKQGCSTWGPDPLPFHILNVGNSGPFHILNFGKLGPFHLLNFKKLAPFHIPFPEKAPLSHTSILKKGPLSHTWSPKKVPHLGRASLNSLSFGVPPTLGQAPVGSGFCQVNLQVWGFKRFHQDFTRWWDIINFLNKGSTTHLMYKSVYFLPSSAVWAEFTPTFYWNIFKLT